MGIGELCALASALSWAISVILFRHSGQTFPPFELNLFKNVLTFALMIPTILIFQGADWPSIPMTEMGLILTSGLIGIGIGDTLYFKALNALGASRTAIAATLFGPFVILLSVSFLGERLFGLQLAGVVLVLAGVVLVNIRRARRQISTAASRHGVTLAVISIFLMAAGIVMVKPALETQPFLWVVFLRIVAGVVGMMLLLLVTRGLSRSWKRIRAPHHWPSVVIGSLMGAYVSMLLWLAGYRYADASIAAVLNETASIWVLVLATIFLHERLSPRQWAGAALAIAGVFTILVG